MNRSRNVQNFIDGMKERMGISDDFVAASDHPYRCRCAKCLAWWLSCGPEYGEPQTWGPFTASEIADAKMDCELGAPHPGDSQYIGDDDDGAPIYVEIEADAASMFMGEVDGCQVWTM